MNRTKIDWCDYTWNPVWGCENSCPYCYARKMAQRWGKSFEPHWMENNFNRIFPKEPSRIFVNSMSDIFYWQHEWWEKVLDKIKEYPQHTFLFLTKHPQSYESRIFHSNCWLGITITCQTDMDYLADYIFTSSWDDKYHFFISMEPILEPIELYVTPDWLIIGAETGNRKDKVIPEYGWIEPYLKLNIPVFLKNSLSWINPWKREYPEIEELHRKLKEMA